MIWAAGVEASPLARSLAEAAGAPVDRTGRLTVQDDLTLAGHPDVFAIGDMVALDGVPGIAPAAMQQGRHAARLIRRRLKLRRRGHPADAPVQNRRARRANAPFRYLDKGSLAVIGHDRAVGLAFGVPVTGFLAILVWGLVHVRYLVGWGSRLVTVVRWLWTLLARNRAERVIAAGPRDARPALAEVPS